VPGRSWGQRENRYRRGSNHHQGWLVL